MNNELNELKYPRYVLIARCLRWSYQFSENRIECHKTPNYTAIMRDLLHFVHTRSIYMFLASLSHLRDSKDLSAREGGRVTWKFYYSGSCEFLSFAEHFKLRVYTRICIRWITVISYTWHADAGGCNVCGIELSFGYSFNYAGWKKCAHSGRR